MAHRTPLPTWLALPLEGLIAHHPIPKGQGWLPPHSCVGSTSRGQQNLPPQGPRLIGPHHSYRVSELLTTHRHSGTSPWASCSSHQLPYKAVSLLYLSPKSSPLSPPQLGPLFPVVLSLHSSPRAMFESGHDPAPVALCIVCAAHAQ